MKLVKISLFLGLTGFLGTKANFEEYQPENPSLNEYHVTIEHKSVNDAFFYATLCGLAIAYKKGIHSVAHRPIGPKFVLGLAGTTAAAATGMGLVLHRKVIKEISPVITAPLPTVTQKTTEK